MRNDHFDAVTVETLPGRHFNINNIKQVTVRLSGHWPRAHKGAVHQKAVKACLDHMRGKKNADAVRATFVDAAKEAHILVREGRHSLATTWTETRPDIFEVRLNANATFLVRQEGARHQVQLPGLGWRKCWSRNQIERVCEDYYDKPPEEE